MLCYSRSVRVVALAALVAGWSGLTSAQQPKVRSLGDSPTAKSLAEANQAYADKDYAKAAAAFEAAAKAGATGSTVPYNAACCYALTGKADDAFTWLNKAIDAGWRDVNHLQADTDLNSLHKDSRWPDIVKKAQEASDKFAKSVKEPELRKELLKRMKEDQRIRMEEKPDFDEWKKIDADNTAWMKTVIDKYGWPTNSMVGEDGALAAFLMTQHADADLEFQKRCFELMKKAVEQKDYSAAHLAYLTDRIRVAEGKPQVYGTQFFSEPGGEPRPRPIEDEANVDKRRAEVGLPPLAEYAAQMKSLQKK